MGRNTSRSLEGTWHCDGGLASGFAEFPVLTGCLRRCACAGVGPRRLAVEAETATPVHIDLPVTLPVTLAVEVEVEVEVGFRGVFRASALCLLCSIRTAGDGVVLGERCGLREAGVA